MKHTIKHANLVKNSFTLLETILSITLLAIVISGFNKSSYYDESSFSNYQLLNNLENKFNTENYSDFNLSTKTINVIINDNETKQETVKTYSFNNENIKVFKYEK